MRPVVAAADLVVGAACPACGRPALAVCRACALHLRPRPALVQPRHLTALDVAAAGRYEQALRAVVLAWKEQSRDPLTRFLAHQLASAILLLDPPGRIALVPVPSSRAARRRRGADLVADLARHAAVLLADVGVEAQVVPALRHARTTADQVGLGAGQRRRNLHHAIDLRRRGPVPDAPVVVVDDVVTTGSTAAEAVRALAVRGHAVSGVAVVAATPVT